MGMKITIETKCSSGNSLLSSGMRGSFVSEQFDFYWCNYVCPREVNEIVKDRSTCWKTYRAFCTLKCFDQIIIDFHVTSGVMCCQRLIAMADLKFFNQQLLKFCCFLRPYDRFVDIYFHVQACWIVAIMSSWTINLCIRMHVQKRSANSPDDAQQSVI